MKKLSICIIIILVSVIACTKKMSPSNTAVKPDASAFFVSTVKPIIEAKCTPCHVPDKGGSEDDFSSLENSAKHIDEMLVRVQLNPKDPKFMPFKMKNDPLTPAEIASLKEWKAVLQK